jgi:hypothetical protein
VSTFLWGMAAGAIATGGIIVIALAVWVGRGESPGSREWK